MCQIHSEPIHAAEEEIICYKILKEIEDENGTKKYVAPCWYFEYEIGDHYVEREKSGISRDDEDGLCIHGGFFHLLADMESVKKAFEFYSVVLSPESNFVVVKCRIPKGTEISRGKYEDYIMSGLGPGEGNHYIICDSICAKAFDILEIEVE